jgi:putative molybdenum carrier protein
VIERVISGGQTGADRGGLDAAIELGVPHLAITPRGRRSEDGCVPDRYQAEELESDDYLVRTRACVERADATVVFTRGGLTPGSMRTLEFAQAAGKPALHVDLRRVPLGQTPEAPITVRRFLQQCEARVVNVAGTRESKARGIESEVRGVMTIALRE